MRQLRSHLRSLIREELTVLNEAEQYRSWCNIVYYAKLAVRGLHECEHFLTLSRDNTIDGSDSRDNIRRCLESLLEILPAMEAKVRGRCDLDENQTSVIGLRNLPSEMSTSAALNKAYASLNKATTNLSFIFVSRDRQDVSFVDQLGPDLSGKFNEVFNGVFVVQGYIDRLRRSS